MTRSPSGLVLPLLPACSSAPAPARLMRDTLTGTYFSRRTGTEAIRQGSWWAARH
jgi:hypothetical protein